MKHAIVLVALIFMLAMPTVSPVDGGTVYAQENTLAGTTYWILSNITVKGGGQGITINYYVVTNESIEFGDDYVRVSYKVVDTNIPFLADSTPTTYTYSYDQYLREVSTSPNKDLDLNEEFSATNASIVFEGKTSWNGYPAFKYTFSYTDENLSGEGELYIHAGLGVPLYLSLNVQDNETTGEILYEVVDSNLPKEDNSAVYEAGNYRITVIAPDGAEIKVEGDEGDTTLNVTNTGTAPGWVVVEKTSASLQAAGSSENIVATVAVMPGESKTVYLPTPLQASVEKTGGGGFPVWLVILIIAAAAVGGIVYKMFSKPKTATWSGEGELETAW